MAKATRAVGASRSRALRRPSTRKLSPAERYDANIDHILRTAASAFADKSFGLASVRHIASRARISFPRIYYYLRSKEELLYLILKRAGEELMRRVNARLEGVVDPPTRLRLFVEGHLEFCTDNLAEMKLLVREAETLSGSYAAEIAELKRDYSRICQRIVEQMALADGKALDRTQSRIVTSLLFGAMNWFHTWFDPTRDYANRGRMADEVCRMVAGSIALR